MSKQTIKQAQNDFLTWFMQQPDKVKYIFATTPYKDNGAVGHFRRSYIKMMKKIRDGEL